MSDGTPVPRAHDGMAAFRARRGRTLLIRNHEVRTAPGTVLGSAHAPVRATYDPLGVGGTTTLLFDTRRGELERHFVSFTGSIVNCAGGITLQGAGWITSEETVAGPPGLGTEARLQLPRHRRRHGPDASPALTAMGRFAHEAIATDPRTGYRLRDRGLRQRQRLLPLPARRPADLTPGRRPGDARRRRPAAAHHDHRPARRRRAPRALGPHRRPRPRPRRRRHRRVALQGIALGAALFNRLEGIWYDPSTQRFLLQLHQRR